MISSLVEPKPGPNGSAHVGTSVQRFSSWCFFIQRFGLTHHHQQLQGHLPLSSLHSPEERFSPQESILDLVFGHSTQWYSRVSEAHVGSALTRMLGLQDLLDTLIIHLEQVYVYVLKASRFKKTCQHFGESSSSLRNASA